MATADTASTSRKSCVQLFTSWNEYIQNYGVPSTNQPPKEQEDGKTHSLVIDKGLKLLPNPNGSPIILTVKFIGIPPGSQNPQAIIEKVKRAAAIWEEFAHIKFKWVGPNEAAIIRCGFEARKGHWSYVGRANTSVRSDKNTMNLEFTDEDSDDEIRGTTLHEFGHAIGCIHEQISPKTVGSFVWNPDVVYAAFRRNLEWPKKKVDENFNYFKAMNANEVEATPLWDRESVMQYEIEPGWTTPSMKIGRNQQLTPYDKWFIGQMYPKPAAAKPQGVVNILAAAVQAGIASQGR